MNLHDGRVSRNYKEAKTMERFISEAEGKLIANHYKQQEFSRVLSHVSQKSIQM